jgi:hypothetical protein
VIRMDGENCEVLKLCIEIVEDSMQTGRGSHVSIAFH